MLRGFERESATLQTLIRRRLRPAR